MRALIKSNKRIILDHIDSNEKVLIDGFIRKAIRYVTEVKELYDVENNPDGLSFVLNEDKKHVVDFVVPPIQILASGGSTTLNLYVESDVHIVLDNPYEEIDVEVQEDNTIGIYAEKDYEKIGDTGQFVVTATLSKEGFEDAIVPINITVLYVVNKEDIPKSYEALDDLPLINSNIVIGNKSSEQLGLQDKMDSLTNQEIDEMFN